MTNTFQREHVITPYDDEERVTVDDLEVAQFIYLLLKYKKIRNVINTIGSKSVLILGRFTDRKHVLDAIRNKVRKLGYLPMIFDFERPKDRDFTETVQTLAGMSRFIVADITKPESVPLEAHALIPNFMVPFVPVIQNGESAFSMFENLWQKYPAWVLPPLRYDSIEQLMRVFEKGVAQRANNTLKTLRKRKIEALPYLDAGDLIHNHEGESLT